MPTHPRPPLRRRRPSEAPDADRIEVARFWLIALVRWVAQELAARARTVSPPGPAPGASTAQARLARDRLLALCAALRAELAPAVRAAGMARRYRALLAEESASAWRRSPFRGIPATLRLGLPEDFTYDDLPLLTGALSHFADLLAGARALPLRLARRAARARRWTGLLGEVDASNQTPAMRELHRWSRRLAREAVASPPGRG